LRPIAPPLAEWLPRLLYVLPVVPVRSVPLRLANGLKLVLLA
jgi:hypothetical protein